MTDESATSGAEGATDDWLERAAAARDQAVAAVAVTAASQEALQLQIAELAAAYVAARGNAAILAETVTNVAAGGAE